MSCGYHSNSGTRHWTPEGTLTTQLFVLEGKLNLHTALTQSTSIWATTRTVITTFCSSKHKLSNIYINVCRNTVNSGWPSRTCSPNMQPWQRDSLKESRIQIKMEKTNQFKLIPVKHVSTPNTPEVPAGGKTCWFWNRQLARFLVSCPCSEKILISSSRRVSR